MTRPAVGAPSPGTEGSAASGEDVVSAASGEGGMSAASSPPEESVPPVAAGGLQLLGSADAVVCEGDLCWVPPTGD